MVSGAEDDLSSGTEGNQFKVHTGERDGGWPLGSQWRK